MKKPLDLTKPVQTRDGRKARIVCANARSVYPIIALVSREDDSEELISFYADGHILSTLENVQGDLINVPAEQKWRPWRVEEYPVGALFRTKGGDLLRTRIALAVTIRGTLQFAGDNGGMVGDDAQKLFDFREHSLDIFKPDSERKWLPCGVLEAAE